MNRRRRNWIEIYDGPCEGGPFDGADIDADSVVVKDDMLGGGEYHWKDGKWFWVQPKIADATKRLRDALTGQYAFDNDFERLCKCGHSLGVHSAGGFYCDTDAIGNNEPEAIGCQCEKFQPSGKRRDPVSGAKERSDG